MTKRGPAANVRLNRDFWLLLSGRLVSFVGDQAQFFALPLVTLAATGSATQAGVVSGLGTMSYLLFGLVAGALVDRWNRKRTMIWCEIGRAVLVATVVVALCWGRLTVAQLYLFAILTGVLSTLFQSANSAALPNVVPADQLPTALGYNETLYNAVRIFGAVAAGALYALGRVVPFALNAVSFAVSGLSLRFIRAEFQKQERAKARPKLTTDIRVGLSWLWHQPVIRFLTLVNAADNVRYGAGYLVIVVLAQQAKASSVQIGLIFSAAAVGALLGALVSDRVTKRYPLGRIAVAMLWIEALGFPLYALAPNVTLIGVVAAIESLVAPVYMVAMTAYRLSITPDELRGRTSSAISTLTTGALSLGTVASGALISWLGARGTVLVLGAWMVGLAVVTSANRAVRTAPVAAPAAPAVPEGSQGTPVSAEA
ncbi:MFS transporter [Kitasatospora sp. GP82]|uniref:MFS transporter n=1 Tax=Kitasatospora sp. GP82 TaxID=3035089 RepID=UPI0024738F03|nr:MFS transporter [Kitasatospora sp. GP82]MDH6128365.1 MFS family permease [Kitasatospora sp. GP82]